MQVNPSQTQLLGHSATITCYRQSQQHQSEFDEDIHDFRQSPNHQLHFFHSLIFPKVSHFNIKPSRVESKELSRFMINVHVYPSTTLASHKSSPSTRISSCNSSSGWIVKAPVDELVAPIDPDFERELRNFTKREVNPSECEFQRIRNCVFKLEASGWYYGQLSWQEATEILQSKAVGTFLVRDSSDPAHLYALSVQTECGPTSIRIHYSNGYFKLDAEDLIAGQIPLFDCVVKLVQYYVQLSDPDKLGNVNHVWLDKSGRRDRVILINRPLHHRVQSLQHLCRLTVMEHVSLQRISQLGLPKALNKFVTDYPYSR